MGQVESPKKKEDEIVTARELIEAGERDLTSSLKIKKFDESLAKTKIVCFADDNTRLDTQQRELLRTEVGNEEDYSFPQQNA